MWSSTQTTVILSLLVLSLLVLLSAVSGLLWSRLRLMKRLEQTVHALRERVDTLESLIKSLSDGPRTRPVHPVGPPRTRRLDPASISPRTPKLIAVPDLSPPPAPAEPDSAHALRRKYREIWSRADAGLDARTIAQASGRPVGQIELILSLRRFDPESNPARASSP